MWFAQLDIYWQLVLKNGHTIMFWLAVIISIYFPMSLPSTLYNEMKFFPSLSVENGILLFYIVPPWFLVRKIIVSFHVCFLFCDLSVHSLCHLPAGVYVFCLWMYRNSLYNQDLNPFMAYIYYRYFLLVAFTICLWCLFWYWKF